MIENFLKLLNGLASLSGSQIYLSTKKRRPVRIDPAFLVTLDRLEEFQGSRKIPTLRFDHRNDFGKTNVPEVGIGLGTSVKRLGKAEGFRGIAHERKSKRRGSSVEFADHRNYTVGDDLRHIDWNVYGRLDKLFLKLFLEEEDLHVYSLVDTSLSMDFGDPTKLHYAKQVAAALAFVGLVNHDRVMIDTFSTQLDIGMPSVRHTARASSG